MACTNASSSSSSDDIRSGTVDKLPSIELSFHYLIAVAVFVIMASAVNQVSTANVLGVPKPRRSAPLFSIDGGTIVVLVRVQGRGKGSARSQKHAAADGPLHADAGARRTHRPMQQGKTHKACGQMRTAEESSKG